jgi:hypothetical protein
LGRLKEITGSVASLAKVTAVGSGVEAFSNDGIPDFGPYVPVTVPVSTRPRQNREDLAAHLIRTSERNTRTFVDMV